MDVCSNFIHVNTLLTLSITVKGHLISDQWETHNYMHVYKGSKILNLNGILPRS